MIAAADAARADDRLPRGAAIEPPKIGEQRGRRALPRTPYRPVATSPPHTPPHTGLAELCHEAVRPFPIMIAAADAARADERLPGGAAIEAPKIGERRGRRVLPRTPCRPVATSPAQHRRHAGFGDLCPEAVGIRDHAGIDLAQRLTHRMVPPSGADCGARRARSEEHTSELQSLMRNSYAVFCLKKKTSNLYGERSVFDD